MSKTIEKDLQAHTTKGGVFAFIILSSLLLVGCNSTTKNTSNTNTGTETQAPVTEVPARNDMSFFVTSIGLGNGANLGGIPGADQHCQKLATAAGIGDMMWRAYLSNQGTGSVNARDRIGNGPWTNAKGVVIARNLTELHSANNITKQTALNEKGEVINGRGDTPNMHDILTGSQPDGTAFTGSEDRTCANWTTSGTGAAMLGHSDRVGTSDTAEARSWNASHLSRGTEGGCSQNDLKSTGGNGLFYCFAVK